MNTSNTLPDLPVILEAVLFDESVDWVTACAVAAKSSTAPILF